MARNRNRIALPFNPDGMTIADAKSAAKTLRGLLQDWERVGDINNERFADCFRQIAEFWEVE